MPAAKVKCQIFVAENEEWSFRIIRGSRIVLAPGETYKLRGGVRRAVRSLAEIACISQGFFISPLAQACLKELDAEQARWNKR